MIEITIETPISRTAVEVASILRMIANRIDDADDIDISIPVQDTDGCFCGHYQMDEEE